MCITQHFNQPGYRVYSEVEQLLLKACKQEDFDSELESICSLYKNDFDPPLLCLQVHTFGVDFYKEGKQKNITSFDIRHCYVSLFGAQSVLLFQVPCLLQLLIIHVMPVTNATLKRVFSALHRVKSYLRTTVLQQ